MNKLIAVAISLIVLCTGVQAQDDANINPLNVARAFALKTPAYFNCSLQGNSLVSNSWQRVHMNFVLRKSDFAITSLTVNGVVIPLTEPVLGIPLGDGGIIRDVYVNAHAYTDTGKDAGYGYAQIPELTASGRIVVTLRPAEVKIELPLNNAHEYRGDIRLEIDDFNYGYGYGIDENGKLFVTLPPVGGRYHYVISRRSDGQPIGEGWLEPYKAVKTNGDAFFGVKYIGNVLGLEFQNQSGEDWISFSIPSFDCSIPTTAGTNVAGKTMFIDVGSGGLEVVVGADVEVHVQKVTENGDMPFVLLEDYSTSDQWSTQTRVLTTSQNIGKVVVTIVPRKNIVDDSTWVSLHRFYLATTSGGGSSGGGKGRPTLDEI